ncbi:MAG: hypothetical protein JWN63_432 [Candidatus Acidoferrum typicum]|nr:hypothetical protein [Candidatus Acidoferrum typicum]
MQRPKEYKCESRYYGLHTLCSQPIRYVEVDSLSIVGIRGYQLSSRISVGMYPIALPVEFGQLLSGRPWNVLACQQEAIRGEVATKACIVPFPTRVPSACVIDPPR